MTDLTYQKRVYTVKFETLPAIIADWLEPHGGVAGKDILDFGCGEGTTAIGFAQKYPVNRVVGVDIMPDVYMCAPLAREFLGLQSLPENLSLHQIEPGSLHNPDDRFDIIYSWSVFEHIDQRILSSVLRQIRGILKPDGYLFVQIAPLFYSSEGSHLNDRVGEPWGHLTNQHNVYKERLISKVKSDEFGPLWHMYTTLNKITVPGLLSSLKKAGFEILKEYTTQEDLDIPSGLTEIYHPTVLLTNQVALLAKVAKA